MSKVKNMSKEEMVAGLKSAVVEVVFEKKNGDERVMECTLNPDYLPEDDGKESKRKPNPDVVTVWDVEVNGWRAFKVDSVKEYTVLEVV